MSDTQLSHHVQTHHIHDRDSLLDALSLSLPGDTIEFTQEGDYGHISLINKSGLLIKSTSKQLAIKASLTIDGISSKIIVENLNIWNDDQSKRQIIIIGKQSKDIIVRHCILSSFPVSMNTLRDKLAGKPEAWINGIRMLGTACDVSNNIIVNVKLGIQGSGPRTTIESNLIQYFSEDAIRAHHHGVKIINNDIFDAVLSHQGETRSRDAILLIPPEDRYNGGELKEVEIMGNVVRSQSRNSSVPKFMQGFLQGISGIDGYFIDTTITSNTLVVNTHSGITLFGVSNLQIDDNKVIASPFHQQTTPGIELFLTRISKSNPVNQEWLLNRPYSVHYSNNQAPLFNVPDEGYEVDDQGHNHFTHVSHELTHTSSDAPILVRSAVSEVIATPPPLSPQLLTKAFKNKNIPTLPDLYSDESDENNENTNRTLGEIRETAEVGEIEEKLASNEPATSVPDVVTNKVAELDKKQIASKSTAASLVSTASTTAPLTSQNPRLHRVANAQEMTEAIRIANQGDTILILRAGNYGTVRITNKSKLRIKSFNTDIPIQANFIIDGSSRLIFIENMQLWNNDVSRRYIIITGKSTTNILVRHCILSTVPVDRNTMHRQYAGNPQQWISGIRMLGSNSHIISNHLMNLRMGVLESGPNTLIQHNLVQFYSEDGIRASNHGVKVIHNNIYDAVAGNPGQSAHRDAIQLIPPKNRYEGGNLINVEIIGNIIQSFTHPPVVPANQRGIVQGIFGSDGYFVNTVIKGNTVMVNSDHGITLNGVRNLELTDNRIIDLSQGNQFNPGIKLYLTRISQHGQQKWLANRPYSLKMQVNQAPTLNIPSEAYSTQDLGGNQFFDRTNDLARGHNPVIIRRQETAVEHTSIPVVTDAVSASNNANTKLGTNGAQGVSVFNITTRIELDRATKIAAPGDTILFKKAGHYGLIRLTNKTGIRIRAIDPNLTINANFLIDGYSKNIVIENLNVWFSERNWKPVILTGPGTTNITIRNCLISSYQVARRYARNRFTGTPKNWVTGIWLRGHGNSVINNHIVNVRAGIVANGENVLTQNNLIQYFTETGIRVINNNMEIDHNNIYDAISKKAFSTRYQTGIQLIPAEDRFKGGTLKSIKITNNVIQAKNSGSPTVENRQGQLQGITLHDGYLSGAVINSNTLVVNTEYGITLNGVSGLSLNRNRVFDSKPEDSFTPGIKLYYTRSIDTHGNHQRTWHSELDYSVSYSRNQAAVFNIPDRRYQANDGGGNDFGLISYHRARGFQPLFTG